jgi:hypothetical protein
MKKITYFVTIMILLIAPLSAAEKKDCSEIKKLSKAYLACKSGNLNSGGITKTLSKVTKGTIDKAKNFGKKVNNPFKKSK